MTRPSRQWLAGYIVAPAALSVVAAALSGAAAACSGGEPEFEFGPMPTETSTPFPSQTPTQVVLSTATPIPPAPAALKSIEHRGRAAYLHGANLPWRRWGCDFGCGSDGGASSTEALAELEPVFARAAESGIEVVRWWMFPGEPSQFTVTAESSHATGIKPNVFADIDAALALAERHDVALVFVLFSSPGQLPVSWLNDEEARQALSSTLGQLFERYRADPRIFAWEVFNEPEWEIWDGRVGKEAVLATVNRVVEQIHSKGSGRATVGSANIEGLAMWADSGLDYYDAHWYDPMSTSACARCFSYDELHAKYQLDRPVVVGEFYAGADVDALERFRDFERLGYAGGWAWSLMPDATQDRMAIDLEASKRFAETRE